MAGKKKSKIDRLLTSSIISTVLFLALVAFILIISFGIEKTALKNPGDEIVKKEIFSKSESLEEIIRSLKSRWPDILKELREKIQ